MTDDLLAPEHDHGLPSCWGFGPEETNAILLDIQRTGPGAQLYIKPQGHPLQIRAIVKPAPDVIVVEDGGGGTNNSFRCPPSTGCP